MEKLHSSTVERSLSPKTSRWYSNFIIIIIVVIVPLPSPLTHLLLPSHIISLLIAFLLVRIFLASAFPCPVIRFPPYCPSLFQAPIIKKSFICSKYHICPTDDALIVEAQLEKDMNDQASTYSTVPP